MSDPSSSDVDKISDNGSEVNQPTTRRPKRSAPRQSLAETDTSGSEDNAVKLAKLKAKRARKESVREDSPTSDEVMQDINRETTSQLNELDRELLVYHHMQEMEITKQREEIRRSLMTQESSNSKKGKKETDSGEDFNQVEYSSSSDSSALQERVKKQQAEQGAVVGYHRPSEVNARLNKKKAMDQLMSKRRDKREADEKRKAKAKNRNVLDIDEIFGGVGSAKSSSTSTSSSRSMSLSSDVGSLSPELRKEIETLAELQKCQITRLMLSRFVHLPFFSKLAIGCFIRIGIGENNGRSVYRIAEITDVVETAKVYNVENTRTNKGVKLRHGVDQRVYRLEFISNKAFEEKEWIQWLEYMKAKNCALPTVEQVNNKEKELQHYETYNLTNTEIDYMVKEKQRFQSAPSNFALEKSQLLKLKTDAEEQGNLARVKEIQHEIDALDAKTDDLEHLRNAKLSAVALINQKRRIEMKQNFLDPKKYAYDPVKYDDPFTRKCNRTRVVSGVSKRVKESGPLLRDPNTGQLCITSSAASTSSQPKADSEPVPSTSKADADAPTIPVVLKKFEPVPKTIQPTQLTSLTRQFAGHSAIELDIDI